MLCNFLSLGIVIVDSTLFCSQETVAIVEKAPHKFNLTPSEVSDRRCFITDVKRKLATIKQQLEAKNAQSGNSKKSTEKQVGVLTFVSNAQSVGRSGWCPQCARQCIDYTNRCFISIVVKFFLKVVGC